LRRREQGKLTEVDIDLLCFYQGNVHTFDRVVLTEYRKNRKKVDSLIFIAIYVRHLPEDVKEDAGLTYDIFAVLGEIIK